MDAPRQLIPLAILIVSCLAEFNSTTPEGKSSCRASLGGASQSEAHRAFILQLGPSEDCTWTLARPGDRAIRIVFSHRQLDPDGSCESEHISVFDGNSTQKALLGKVCSDSDYVPVFESSSNTLTVQIVTNAAKVPRTVFIFYYDVSAGVSIPNCGGHLGTPDGSFTSPNYPKPHPAMAYCVWHIRVEKGYTVQLNFKDIFLEADEDCRFDFIAVYDGPSTTSGLMGQVCGRAAPTFQSSSNSVTVVLATDYANSYRGFSASYSALYAETVHTTSLTCSSYKMRAIISKSYLESLNYQENNLQLKDPTCRPRVSNVVEFSIPLDGCGTIRQVAGGSVTYTNAITFAASPASAVITRRKSLQLVVRCEMERNSTVEMMYLTEEDVIHDQSALGKYNTTMALFESSAFEKPLLQSPYFVDLNQNIFAQVSLHTADPNLVVFLDTCSASPTHDFVSPTYDLIRSGCSQDETCKVYPLSGHDARFQFNAFKFLRSLGSVYLRCKVFICDSGDHQSRCNQGCVSRRKRDIASYKWKADAVLGPIRLKRDRRAGGSPGPQDQGRGGEAQSRPSSGLHLLAVTVLALNAVIAAIAVMRRVVNRRADCKYQKLQDCPPKGQP